MDSSIVHKEEIKEHTFSYPKIVSWCNKAFASYAQKPIEVDALLRNAQKKSGLDDFGDEFFMPALEMLVQDANDNTRLHALGRFLLENKLQLNLENRLWAMDWIKRDESILEPLPPVVLISGLQRTGTTFLQRLMGALPEFRGVVSWEIVNPVPKSKEKNYTGKMEAKFAHFALNYINPEFKSIHSVNHMSLEEEVVMMDHAFVSTATQAALNVPNYAQWLEQQDQRPAYLDLKMWLQFLMWRKPAQKFLLLKSPHHMEYMPAFMHAFPNTKIIHTHREPEKTLASYCSMVYYGKKIFSPYADPYAIGKYWLRKDKRLMDYFLDFRRAHDEQFIDVAYKSLVADPIAVVEQLYQQLGLQWTDEHKRLALDFCAFHKKNKYGKHQYALEDYGLNRDDVNLAFADYLNDFEEFL